MTRIAVVAPKAVQEDVIEALHDVRLAHIEEYSKGDEPDLDIGKPLPKGSRASELLVRLRAIIHALDLEGPPNARFSTRQVQDRLENELPRIEQDVRAAREAFDDVDRALAEVHEEQAKLRPLGPLPLELDDYRGYDQLRVFVGDVPEDISGALSQAIDKFEYFASSGAHAVFVHSSQAEKAQEVLAREGFREIEVPQGTGTVQANLQRLQHEQEELAARRAEGRSRLDGLARQHGAFVLAAEEDLSIQVEKAEAPLNFASTERAFVVDAWVPTSEVAQLQRTLDGAAGGSVHFEVIDHGGRDEHHRAEEPPTKYDHPPGVRRFGFLLDVFSKPRYNEIDPTIVLFLVFPLFFGFMIGDLGYGLLMVALGFFLWNRIGRKSPGAASLGFALLLSGIWATLFGAIVFHDVLGIPFAPHGGGHGDEGLSWEGLLGVHFGLGDPILEKLGDEGVKAMLALSILAAFVHLFLGFVFGFVNELGHDKKHAVAKLGWMGVLTGFFIISIVMGPENAVSEWAIGLMGHPDAATSLFFLGPGVLVLIFTEGAIGVMETLGLLSNIISYTRLAGVAVAKGAMAGAFNFIFLEEMALHSTAIWVVVIGFILFVLAQMIVFVLGLISSGIQGIRLNYVEFFLKFYKGGGREFSPFGRTRSYTLNPSE